MPALNHNSNRPITRNPWVGSRAVAVVEEAAGADRDNAKVIAIIDTMDGAVAISADAGSAEEEAAEAAADKINNSAVSHARRSHRSSPTAKPSAGSIRNAKVDSFAEPVSVISPSQVMPTCRCN